MDSIGSSGLSSAIDLTLFALCFGALITLIVTLSTVDITSPKLNMAYVGATIVSGVLSLWFGLRSIVSIRTAKKKLKEIKENRQKAVMRRPFGFD